MAGKTFKLPKTLAGAADLLYQTREKRLLLDKEVTELKSQETQLKTYLIDNLPKSEATGVAGRVARATIVTKDEPTVEDWDQFRAYVKKHNAWDLLQKRVGVTAVKARWEEGEEIPGVGHFQSVDVSLSKVK
jgi:hypothetical protein